jgi:hypothetical protein
VRICTFLDKKLGVIIMTNGFELNDEQLEAVTGGRSSNHTNVGQFANSFTFQGNAVQADTNVFAIGGGRNSGVQALAQGSTNNVGNTSVSLNSNTL